MMLGRRWLQSLCPSPPSETSSSSSSNNKKKTSKTSSSSSLSSTSRHHHAALHFLYGDMVHGIFYCLVSTHHIVQWSDMMESPDWHIQRSARILNPLIFASTLLFVTAAWYNSRQLSYAAFLLDHVLIAVMDRLQFPFKDECLLPTQAMGIMVLMATNLKHPLQDRVALNLLTWLPNPMPLGTVPTTTTTTTTTTATTTQQQQ